MRERELKLAVGDTFVVPDLVSDQTGVAAATELAELELGSVYHDTADLRLARHGVTLRYRVGDPSGPTWTLKLPVAGRDASERDEIDFEGGPATVPQAARNLVAALVRHAVLAPAAALSTRRRRWLLSRVDGRPIAELCQDDVSVLDGDREVARFRELELESRGPDLSGLLPIARELQRAGAVPAPPVSKAVRALGARATAAPDVVPVTPTAAATAGDAVHGAIAAGLLKLLANDPTTRLGDGEALHQMRVATRRLRSDLRTFAGLLDPEWCSGLIEELRWLGGQLGAVRDLDVELATLHQLAADLEPDIGPLLADLRRRREAARETLLRSLGEARYLDLLDRLVDAARRPMLLEGSDRAARKVLPALAWRAVGRLRRRTSRVSEESNDAVLHRVRVAAKRARYAAEAVGPFLGRRRDAYQRLARAAAKMQDSLGALQDAVVLEADTRGVLAAREGDAAFAFVAGQLVGRLEAVRADARAAHAADRRRLLKAAAAVKPR